MDWHARVDRLAAPSRLGALVFAGTLGLLVVGFSDAVAAGSKRATDPSTVVPMEKLKPSTRESVAEVIREASFHRQGAPDTFPANPQLYLALLNEPSLTLSLWQDLSPTPAKLAAIGDGRYRGTDGAGTSATWEFAYRSPRLHVMLCSLDYAGPRGQSRLSGRIVLVVKTAFFKEPSGEPWIRHEVEAFVKIDSRGWNAVAVTVRPLIEKLLEDQVQEAGWFVSLMARMVEMYPTWAVGVTQRSPALNDPTRQAFRELVAQHKRPGAFEGRPQLAEAAAGAGADTRRR